MARILFKVAVYLLLFLSFTSYAHGQSRTYVPGEVIVKIKGSDPSRLRSMNAKTESGFIKKASSQKGLTLKASYSKMGVYHFAVKPGQRVEEAIGDLQNDPDVEYAEPNYIYSKASVESNVQAYTASEVQAMTVGATSNSYLATSAPIQVTNTWGQVSAVSVPVVAVVDTGLDITHAVFTGSNAIWTNPNEIPANGIDDDNNGYIDDVHGWNFVSNSGAMIDDDGHGTHVSGIILGVGQNVYAPPFAQALIKIMPLKFLDGSGYGNTSDAIKAIYYAVNNGATVINNSWGGPSYSASLNEAIAYAYDHGVVFVAAAGNLSANNDLSASYPANYNVPNVISVAATADNDTMAYFSNYGKSSVPLAAPGVYILSTYPGGGYMSMSGTSMATPFVSGVAALMKAEQPNMLAYQIKQIITGNIDVPTDGNGNPTLANRVSTSGRLDVFNSVQATKTATVSNTQPTYTFTNTDRALASSIAASGCGLVSKMIDKGSGGPGSSTGTESWSVILVVGLFALPVLMYNLLRKKTPVQRRVHERFVLDTAVKIMVGDKEMVGKVSTISQGGVQLNTNALIEQGGIVSMTIRSPDGSEQLQVEGRVVWSEAQKAYGVQFAETSQTIRERITMWTKALAKAS